MCPETESDSRFRIFLQISKIVFVPILLSTLFSCESIEFIPDTILREEFGFSHKSSWNEIEIRNTSPPKPYRTYGKVIIRSFANGRIPDYMIINLKKELFTNHMDGVIFTGKGIVNVPPVLVHSGNGDGNTVVIGYVNNEMGVIEGVAYRYKDNLQ
ncbi:hypothetical protein LEP1GSC132_0707 [Leptospira kirschneri str. 200803703]|uniref:Uncharacterized protein n=4 Tax=Leptospira kirschneri TaxID=29507 RepID=A0A1T1DIN0_9LEPT|nr:hypothetical protein LEP1GSC044_1030 [Leptospira kirschneri serovar Grippotyphosa str. RM52]EKO16858.1 hypothetical protein LEP1GSC081_2758 [Leptospira kirschneri str. H1]EKO50383.1 hypothetical protein LEP1GSC131_1084 [Leptospira kirschneri str. 200802841]EKP05579.1 hypothetical protein LEP1GSC018_3991 [Leptospira kirschneri str. 2008720114]EMJ93604.1 hypothetical protein LEP1GSC198_3628 [Leptospira kirschneri str. JB]EMK02444.1 hypothetical protein LEP1GSC176_3287 [Leptospira kirschneri s